MGWGPLLRCLGRCPRFHCTAVRHVETPDCTDTSGLSERVGNKESYSDGLKRRENILNCTSPDYPTSALKHLESENNLYAEARRRLS